MFDVKQANEKPAKMKRVYYRNIYRAKSQFTGLLYISPWLIGFFIFQFYPLISSFFYSFMDFNMFSKREFVGMQNYIYMLTKDELFWKSLKVTFTYVFLSVPLKLVSALLIAMLLNMKLKFVNFFRTVYYIPSIMGGSVAISILWKAMFMKDGYFNSLLSIFSIPPTNWLGNPSLAIYTLSSLVVWQFGSSMVIFLAGLKQIPSELYEACKVDGASRISMFFNITLPLLSPIIFFNLIMQLINAFQEFTGALVITNGGPVNATYLYVLKVFDDGFRFFKMGYASALSWVLFVIILIFTSLIFKSSTGWVYYTDGGR
jgi:oligogalacturonide transport system permease protein